MEDKRLDLNAPLLSVRRHFSGPLPPPPSSLSSSSFTNGAAAVADSGAEGGGGDAAGQGARRSSLPLYKSDLKSGPVRNAGAIPFVWEQFPGLPKIGSGDAPNNPVGEPLVASKLPSCRIPRRLSDEQEGPIRRDASDGSNDGVLQRRYDPMSSASTSTAPTSSAGTTTATAVNGSFFTSSGSSRDVSKVNSRHSIENPPTLEEQPCSCDGGDEEEDAYSDALDTLSRVDTFSMNCSISGLSAGVDSREPSGTFSTDPGLRDFMMGRFLPAAQAMAASPPPYAPRKPSVPSREPARRVIGKAGDGRRQSVPLPYQHRPSHVLNYASVHHQTNTGNSNDEEDEEEEDDEYGSSGHLSVKGCGLLPRFCLKSSFCLLNPVPGMKVRGHMPTPTALRRRPQVKASHHGSVGVAEDEHTWKEVYEHKLGRVHQILGEEASKMTSESNQLSYWSDSQTADGSSSFRRSTGGGISPCRNGVSRSPFHEWKNFVRVPDHGTMGNEDDEVFDLSDKSVEKYWEAMPHRGSSQTSGSQSPVVEKTLYVDSVEVLEDPGFRLSLSGTKITLDGEGNDSEIVGKSKRVEESLMLEACDDIMAQNKLTEVVDADELHFAERSGAVEMMGNAEDDMLDVPRHLRAEDQGKNGVNAMRALLPPPLPKSPSESWLWRTLPSVASKNSAPLSLLGIQHYPKKQVDRASLTDPKRETNIKKSGVTKRQMRFADVLARPANEQQGNSKLCNMAARRMVEDDDGDGDVAE
ncbi:hypothetical protein Taro_051013 [Colocasia esculenta]|uniref:Uncharacterized protein n=1 Tax=Colocasia esculenta TaxID=4460 RepID=A0A843XEV7_COLES|nr:hypothetical protein [Colocasia esculenta]